jgi:hypothetical protein
MERDKNAVGVFQGVLGYGRLLHAIGAFLGDDESPLIQCPVCRQMDDSTHWKTEPDLGMGHVAAVFWNWPNFDSNGWRISVPEIAAQAIGNPLIMTYGKV